MPRTRTTLTDLRPEAFGADVDALAARALGRAAGSQSTEGNDVRLLLDASENFPAWLDAIRKAERLVLFECYIVDDDEIGREFADALSQRASDGVQVYVLYDWLGSFRSRGMWERLRGPNLHVAAFNAPQFGSPLGWITRDHRKMIAIDGKVGFVSGLCVSGRWLGRPSDNMDAWRDTGVAILGPAVADLEQAFRQVWRVCAGPKLPKRLTTPAEAMAKAGETRVRVIAGQPSSASTYRLDLLIAALAHERLWITDAYFVGTAAYVQALRAAARDGVDVRLLVPGASDIPAVSMLSRAGYRALLDAGVRVFEWNGSMLHAKTAVADDHWTRIGSTNLNLASLLGNYELDVAIENLSFARRMSTQFEKDLGNATEIVLTPRKRVRRAERNIRSEAKPRRSASGSAGRFAAGAVSVGSALGAALTNRRAIGRAEAGMLGKMAIAVLALGVVAALWPQVVAWPAAIIAVWVGLAWLSKAVALKRSGEQRGLEDVDERDELVEETLATDSAEARDELLGATHDPERTMISKADLL
ncbi:MAG TPA: phospholipase D-like domain-containing protein [Casimicrobiaceae bacterium]|nr:phospholipase D-like domain-containing protein [Casimicrobiaceae bacterium]